MGRQVILEVNGKKLHLKFGHTLAELYKKNYDENVWDFPFEELVDGTVEINEDIWYWYINGRCYETNEETQTNHPEMKKIYIITQESADGGCLSHENPLPFASHDKAIKEFRRLVKKATKDNGDLETVELDKDHCLTMYNEGSYSEDHVSIVLHECDIIE